MIKIIENKNFIRNVGIFLIGLFFYGYVLFPRVFAELHIQFPFFNFPIFVGEILLIICFILSLFIVDIKKIKKWHWGIIAFAGFILVKAFYGYYQWGPLAFRHAALFYYPILILFGMLFYRKEFFSEPVKLILIFSFFIIFLLKWPMPYGTFTVGSVFLVLAMSLKSKWIRRFCLLLLFFSFPFAALISAPRNVLLGNLFGIIFLVIALLIISRIKYFYKIIMGVFMIIFIFLIMFKYSFMNAFSSVVDIKGNIERYKIYENQRIRKQESFELLVIENIRLYNPERVKTAKDCILSKLGRNIKEIKIAEVRQKQKKPQEAKPQRERDLEIAYNNAVFRFFVWRDMMSEFLEKKAFLGLDFGWPLRSVSIETLNWGYSKWSRDGWIDGHNSYLTMIYRAGIIGFIWIIFLISLLCVVIRDFIILKSVSGIILCSVFISWFVSANFMPIFEMPYYAIPLWSLFGVTLAYLKDIKKSKKIKN